VVVLISVNGKESLELNIFIWTHIQVQLPLPQPVENSHFLCVLHNSGWQSAARVAVGNLIIADHWVSG
jgi:hypothetical protein